MQLHPYTETDVNKSFKFVFFDSNNLQKDMF